MEEGKKKRFNCSISWKGWIALLLILASLGAAGYFWNEARQAESKTPEATQARNAEETGRIVSELGSILLIEGDQEPTVARVEDPSVLQDSNPDFYKNAAAGDYLVLYPQRAIVYRSEVKQIINIAPIINTDQIQQEAEEQTTQQSTESADETEQ